MRLHPLDKLELSSTKRNFSDTEASGAFQIRPVQSIEFKRNYLSLNFARIVPLRVCVMWYHLMNINGTTCQPATRLLFTGIIKFKIFTPLSANAPTVIKLVPNSYKTINKIFKFTETDFHLTDENLPKLMENFYTQIVFSDAFSSHSTSIKLVTPYVCVSLCVCV